MWITLYLRLSTPSTRSLSENVYQLPRTLVRRSHLDTSSFFPRFHFHNPSPRPPLKTPVSTSSSVSDSNCFRSLTFEVHTPTNDPFVLSLLVSRKRFTSTLDTPEILIHPTTHLPGLRNYSREGVGTRRKFHVVKFKKVLSQKCVHPLDLSLKSI